MFLIAVSAKTASCSQSIISSQSMSNSQPTSNSQNPSDSKEPYLTSELPPPKKPKNARYDERLELVYDVLILMVITLDLFLIGLDLVLMSNFATHIADWMGGSHVLNYYIDHIHTPLRIAGGFFTLFLGAELMIRWVISVWQKEYTRWFFFPFIHWYEVLGCFPQLRALRLLRAIVIGRKLHQLGYLKIPKRWLEKSKFYYDLVFEEISDRVILTATDQMRHQFTDSNASKHILAETLKKNRPQLEAVLTNLLKKEIVPQLRRAATGETGQLLANQVGASVNDALTGTKELRRYVRMIPIAGKLIEVELQNVGQHFSENLTRSLTQRLTQTHITDDLIDDIVSDLVHINLSSPELDALIASIVDNGLTAFEQQVKVQQWKNHKYFE